MSKRAAIAAAGLLAAGAAAGAGARIRWNRATAAAVNLLRERALPIRSSERRDVPGIVARYFAFALPPDAVPIERATIRQRGVMRGDVSAPWMPFRATEEFSVRPPGFVWDAKASAYGILPVLVRDSYVDGVGETRASLAAMVPAGYLGGTREIASASLVRYLAEAVWFPTALLPECGVSWIELGKERARASLDDRGVNAAVDFTFGPDGSILEARAQRYRTVGSGLVLTPWLCRYRAYRSAGGMMVPSAGDVSWLVDGTVVTVWRGQFFDLRYAPAGRASLSG